MAAFNRSRHSSAASVASAVASELATGAAGCPQPAISRMQHTPNRTAGDNGGLTVTAEQKVRDFSFSVAHAMLHPHVVQKKVVLTDLPQDAEKEPHELLPENRLYCPKQESGSLLIKTKAAFPEEHSTAAAMPPVDQVSPCLDHHF